VHFVDEEDFARLEVAQDGREIARPLDHRARGRPHRHAQLVGDHVRERGLAQTRRAVQQHVIERLPPLPRCGDRDVQVLAETVLPDVLVERPRPQSALELDFVGHPARGDEAVLSHSHCQNCQH
jgi:hypothetical protein